MSGTAPTGLSGGDTMVTIEQLEQFYSHLQQYDDGIDPVECAKRDMQSMQNPWQHIHCKEIPHGWICYQAQPLAYYVHNLWVDPGYRGQGIGKKLLQLVPTDEPTTLFVYNKNPAKQFYEHLGFRKKEDYLNDSIQMIRFYG